MSDGMLSLLDNIRTAKAEIERLRSRLDSRRCPQCDHLRLELGDARRELAEKDRSIEELERLAELYSDGNQVGARRLSIALGLEDDD